MSETTTAGINSKGTAESDSANVKESENRKQTAGNGSKNKVTEMIAVNLLEALAKKSNLGHFYSESENKCTLTIKWYDPDKKYCDTKYEGNSADGDTAKKNAATEALNNHFILKHLRSSVDNFEKQYHKGKSETGYVLVVCFNKDREDEKKEMENIMRNTLKFDVESPMISEKSKTDMEKFLENKAAELNEKGKDYYCFTFLIIGNVDEKGIKTTNDEHFTVEEIVKYFKNHGKKQNYMTGKPKVFFIQNCPEQKTTQTDSLKKDNKSIESVPVDADIYVAFSYTDGFITKCADKIKESYPTMHLENMMIDVKHRIAGDEDGHIPYTTSTLRKPLYFMPKKSN